MLHNGIKKGILNSIIWYRWFKKKRRRTKQQRATYITLYYTTFHSILFGRLYNIHTHLLWSLLLEIISWKICHGTQKNLLCKYLFTFFFVPSCILFMMGKGGWKGGRQRRKKKLKQEIYFYSPAVGTLYTLYRTGVFCLQIFHIMYACYIHG